MNAFRVDNRIVQEADNMAKELQLSFRDCLEILMNTRLQEREKVSARAKLGKDGARGNEFPSYPLVDLSLSRR